MTGDNSMNNENTRLTNSICDTIRKVANTPFREEKKKTTGDIFKKDHWDTATPLLRRLIEVNYRWNMRWKPFKGRSLRINKAKWIEGYKAGERMLCGITIIWV